MVADVFRDRGRHVDAARMNGQSGVCQGGMETSFKGDVTVFSIEISPIIRFNSFLLLNYDVTHSCFSFHSTFSSLLTRRKRNLGNGKSSLFAIKFITIYNNQKITSWSYHRTNAFFTIPINDRTSKHCK